MVQELFSPRHNRDKLCVMAPQLNKPAGQQPLRIDIALIPDEPLFSAIIDASQAITARFQNQNIIDADKFPPHASLHICTIPSTRLESLFERLKSSMGMPRPMLKPKVVKIGSAGYVSLQLELTSDIRHLHEATLAAVAEVRSGFTDERKAYVRYGLEDQQNYEKYGNAYVLEKFDLHTSIAKVAPFAIEEAFNLANEKLGMVRQTQTKSLQICDIGMKSEKWVVLKAL